MALGRRGDDLLGPLGDLLAAHGLDLLRKRLVALEHFLYGLQHLRVVEVFADVAHRILGGVDDLLGLFARDGFDAAHAGRNGALGQYLEEPDVTRSAGVRTAAELDRRTEAHHAHLVAVLLAEEHHGTAFLGLLLGGLAVLLQRIVGADGAVDEHLDLAQLGGSHLLEMRKVEAQDLGRHHRTLLLYVRSQHLAQRLVHEVRRGMVVGRGLAFGSVHDGRELGRRVFGKLLDDMDNQSVFLFGSHDGDALVGILDIADVTDLTARVAVERRAVED